MTTVADANRCGRRIFAWIAWVVTSSLFASVSPAAQVSRDTAMRAATGWLVRNPAPMETSAGRPASVSTYSDDSGRALFHVVSLEPTGFVVMAADDEVEPVFAFSSESKFLARSGMPLFDLLKRDAAMRIAATRRGQAALRAVPSRASIVRTQWTQLLAAAGDDPGERVQARGTFSVSDVCVAPLVLSRWDQVSASVPAVPPATGPTELYIYNYYTPPFGPGHPYNYAAGCSVVAWAQIMRFHAWPKVIGVASYGIGIDGYGYLEPMMGGDGRGGAYDWANMPLVPDGTTTIEQIKAIGALMHDAGVGTGVGYYYFGTYGTTSARAIKEVFHYAEAKTCVVQTGLGEVMNALRTSLDAGLPANLNIFTEDDTGHALVVDGYGYNAGTRYHHLNMGWSGHCDAWYNFPPIDVVMGDGSLELFTLVTSVAYNIDPQVAGEMITGRITSEDGRPVAGATVAINTTPARSVTTNSRGIYAVKGLASNATYALSAAADGRILTSDAATVTTGDATVEVHTTPNRIVDFRASEVSVAVANPQGTSVGSPVTLSVAANAAQPVHWQRNGSPLPGTASLSLTLASRQPAQAGIYGLSLSAGTQTIESGLAIVGIGSATKVVGAGREVLKDTYVASNGNTFDQVLLEGPAAAITADYSERQITRLSFVDLDDDIVQVEYSGPGTLTLTLDDPTGPSLPANYRQNVTYMKGHASIVITDATQDSHVSVFSVGKANAANPALFKPEVNYDGVADVAFIAISSRDGKFGGVRAANANFFAARGVTGVYAPGVAITGPLYLGNITAFDAAKPMICVGSAADVRITGGDLYQENGEPIRVSGLAGVTFTDGANSHGSLSPAKLNRGTLRADGVDVTVQLVVSPALAAEGR